MRKFVTSAILGVLIFAGGTYVSAGETTWISEDDVSLGWMQPRMSLEQVHEVYGPMKDDIAFKIMRVDDFVLCI